MQSRQSLLEVTHIYPNKVEVVWHLHPTNLSVWIWMLSNHQGGCTHDWCSWSVVLENTAWNQMAPICSQWGSEEDNQATWPYSNNRVTTSLHIWAHCMHGWWSRCQDDPNGSSSRELEETIRASPYHVAEHCPTRPDSLQPYTERSSRCGSESPSVEADVYVWH